MTNEEVVGNIADGLGSEFTKLVDAIGITEPNDDRFNRQMAQLKKLSEEYQYSDTRIFDILKKEQMNISHVSFELISI